MELRCPMCGGTDFDGPRRFKIAGWAPNMYVLRGMALWRFRDLQAQARVCLGCGHVDQVVDPEKLRERLARLEKRG